MGTHGPRRFLSTWVCLGLSLLVTQAPLWSRAGAEPTPAAARRLYRIDRGRSRVTIETHSSTLLSDSTRTHLLGARDFRGELSMVPDMLETTAVDFTVRADSLGILDQMSDPSRRDIDLAIRKVLDSARYPRIVFHSSAGSAKRIGPEVYDVAASGTLELHGVRRPLTVSAQVAVEHDALRIRGKCPVRQTDYGMVPFSLGKGAINVADEVTLTFDLVATTAPGHE